MKRSSSDSRRLPRTAAQPRAARALRQEPPRRAAALRAAGLRKTYIARALAGELGAGFLSVGLADVLDMWIGSERAEHRATFPARRAARRRACCSSTRSTRSGRGAADARLRDARRGQPAAAPRWTGSAAQTRASSCWPRRTSRGTSTRRCDAPAGSTGPCSCCRRTPGPRGDLALPPRRVGRSEASTCAGSRRPPRASPAPTSRTLESAAEIALLDSVRSGTARPISARDLDAAVRAITPSTGQWFESARTVLEFGEDDGTHAELKRT